MKRSVYVFVAAAVMFAVRPAVSQDKPTGFRADLLDQIEGVKKEIIDLEHAIPQDKMTWRPNKDVRSISEVYLHIAFGNYFLAKMAGIEVPADVKLPSPNEESRWDVTTTDKKAIAESLEKSFAFLAGAVKTLPDANLDKAVTFFGHQTTVRGMMMTALSHMHEHLGQSIAYARMNGIVPPWTAARQAPKKDKG